MTRLMYQLRQDRFSLFCAVVFAVLASLTVLAPLIAPFDPYDPKTIDIMNSEYPPVWVDGSDPQFCWALTPRGGIY